MKHVRVYSVLATIAIPLAACSSGSDLASPSLTIEPSEGLATGASIGDLDDSAGMAVTGNIPADADSRNRLVIRMVAGTDEDWEIQDSAAFECDIPACDVSVLDATTEIVEIQWLTFDSRPSPEVRVSETTEGLEVAIAIGPSADGDDVDGALTPDLLRTVLYLDEPLGDRTLTVGLSQ